MVQLNCNGISGKLSEIKMYIYTKKPDIVCLCETWLTDMSRQPVFVGYDLHWQNRNRGERGRGGLMTLIRKDIKYKIKQLVLCPTGGLELHAFTLSTSLGSLDIVNIYNPWKCILTDEFIHYIRQLGQI
jgi:exonuclease III